VRATTVGKLSTKQGVIYPQIRLLRNYHDIIGENVKIFETTENGKLAFFIITERDMSDEQVLKLHARIVKPSANAILQARINELESHFERFKDTIF
jgi:hypothetical protein